MLAERIEQLTGQINELDQRLPRLVEHHARSCSTRWASARAAPSLS
ncbi:hypothetical protein [Streptomyces tendae]